MTLEEYIAERERRDPEFKKAGEELGPLYEYRDELVKARIAAGLAWPYKAAASHRTPKRETSPPRQEGRSNMDSSDIIKLRLYNTGLSHAPFTSAAGALRHLGAVQAQDYGAAKWALGLRMKDAADEDIETAFNEGAILRTHVLRPTWHFVLPEDIRWMLELTAPQVKRMMAASNRKLGLDDALLAGSNAEVVKALQKHKYLTRQELKSVLASIDIETNVQRLAHIIMWAELDGLICSGPRRGKQFTYALLEERAPEARKLSREEAMAKLAVRYFTSHGPAQLADFTWWSGLGSKDAGKALDSIKGTLTQVPHNGKTYWFSERGEEPVFEPSAALLLSLYDEYTIAYKDRSDLSDGLDVAKMLQMGNASTAVIVLNGRVAGTWSKALKKNAVEVKLSPFRKLNSAEQAVLESEVRRYERFVGRPAVVKRSD